MEDREDIVNFYSEEEKNKLSEQRFKAAIRAVEGILWTNNSEGKMEGEQPGWAALTGQEYHEYQGFGWAKAVHPDDSAPTIEVWNEAVRERKTFVFEHRVKLIDGKWGDFSIKAIPIFNENGVLREWVGVHTNITDLKLSQKKLKENKEKLSIVIDASELGTFELNLIKDEIFCSDRFRKIFGNINNDKLSHADYINRLHQDDLAARNDAFFKALETGLLQYQARIIWSDQTIHWIEVKGKIFFNEFQNPEMLIGTCRDITLAKISRQELEESEQKFRLLSNSMPQFIWTSDPDGNLNYFNKSVYEYSGLSIDHIAREGWLQIVHPDDREKNIKLWKYAISSGNNFLFEHRFKRYDGVYRWQLSRAIPQRDENGNIQMWVGTSTDIEDQKTFSAELEKQVMERTNELEHKNLELEKMNKELKSFAYISSHDLQEPLRKIQTFSTRLMEKEYNNLSDSGKEQFERMQKAAERMQTLIDDLLAYSRTNTAERNYELIHLNTIINEIKSDLKEELLQSNATIETNEMCEINIIRFQFRQLMQNLISNALKFRNPLIHPHIIINSKIENSDKLDFKERVPNKDYCHISIADNGIGFDQKYSERIFELFQRLHGRSQYAGTGIGLAIVKKIVENHNGIITATSELNKGATFDIYLPVT